MNGKKAREARRTRAAASVSGGATLHFVRALEPGDIATELNEFAPPGATQVEVRRWHDPADGALLLDLRTVLPPSGHGRGLCIMTAYAPEVERAAFAYLSGLHGLGVAFGDSGEIHPLWVGFVDLP